jgi:hypothetical protein
MNKLFEILRQFLRWLLPRRDRNFSFEKQFNVMQKCVHDDGYGPCGASAKYFVDGDYLCQSCADDRYTFPEFRRERKA